MESDPKMVMYGASKTSHLKQPITRNALVRQLKMVKGVVKERIVRGWEINLQDAITPQH